jgi:hypothetical protein
MPAKPMHRNSGGAPATLLIPTVASDNTGARMVRPATPHHAQRVRVREAPEPVRL